MHNSFITEEYKREDIEKSWSKFEGPLTRLDKAFETNVWPCNPKPLCGYCPVKTCDYYRG
jgi:hypothetical protein